ncbi:MAG: ATP synthase F0 subunit C [Clostridia bacterium]|nr:ATP synthase F0 subunit C [Clostridia bacterium]
MKNSIVKTSVVLFAVLMLIIMAAVIFMPANVTYAEDGSSQAQPADNSKSSKAIAAGVAIGLAALGGAIGMGIAVAKANDGISRQPEADGKIRTNTMLGLVFIETAIIYALIVTILIIFVL